LLYEKAREIIYEAIDAPHLVYPLPLRMAIIPIVLLDALAAYEDSIFEQPVSDVDRV